jgi:hypothetical protein
MPLYNRGKLILVNGTVDWAGATDVEVLLVDDTYTFDADHNFVSDVSGDELPSADNYARQDLAGRTLVEDDATDRAVFDATDFSIAALGPATSGPIVGGAIIFVNAGGADSANPLIAYVPLVDTQVNGSDFTITWSSDGVFYLGDA